MPAAPAAVAETPAAPAAVAETPAAPAAAVAETPAAAAEDTAALLAQAREIGKAKGVIWLRRVLEEHKVARLSDLPAAALVALVALEG